VLDATNKELSLEATRTRSEVVGREAELEAIERVLVDSGTGLAALLFDGEAGIGKTTVFREALRLAGASGFEILACFPADTEGALSFSAVGDLLNAVPVEHWGTLPLPQRRALEVALLQLDAGGKPVDRRAVGAGVLALAKRMASEAPVLLAIDDVQWLDPESAATLEFVLRRLGPERIGLVATRRLGEPGRLDLEAVLPGDVLTRTRIGPLSLGALQHLLRREVGASLPRSTLVRIHGASRGNPLFALEIGRALSGHDAVPADEPLPVPTDVRELVRERVAALPAVTRDVLLAAALLAKPTARTLARLFARLLDDLEPAEIAGIAAVERDVVVFEHPLFAAAVVANTTSAQRRRMRRRLADVVEDVEERARHLAAAADGPDERTAELLEEGATAARTRGGLHSAAELLERARRLTPRGNAAAAHRRGILAAELHLHAGDRGRARSLLEELLGEELLRPERAEALRLLAEISVAEEDVLAAEGTLAEALELADEARAAARIQVELLYTAAHRTDFALAAEYGRQALANLAETDDGPLLAEALAYCANAEYLSGQGVDWTKLERALELEDPDRISLPGLPPRGVAALVMMYVGRHALAREHLAATRRRLEERGDEGDLGHALIWMSWLETRCGNFAAAAELADEAVTCASLTANRAFHRWATGQRAWVDAHLGDVASARRRCAEASLPDQRGVAQIWIAATLALVEISLGDHEAAWQAAHRLTEALEQHGIGEPVPLIFLPDTLEALIALGELGRAEALLDQFETRGRELDRSWALATGGRCRGLLLGARGNMAGAVAALDAALLEHERLDIPFERARTLFAKGILERRNRRRGHARRALEEAAVEFERMGARLWAERARTELDRIGRRRRIAPDELTPSERRAAELAAQGLSNKEIAAALFVTVHTVEVHLSHAYAKLGVRSRAQLTGRLARTV